MQSNGLETDEIISRRDRGRNGGSPGRVLVNHLAVSPIAVSNGSGDQSGLIDFELNYCIASGGDLHKPTSEAYPFQSGSVHSGTCRTRAFC